MRWGRRSLEKKQNLSWPMSTSQSQHPQDQLRDSDPRAVPQSLDWVGRNLHPLGLVLTCALPASSVPALASCCSPRPPSLPLPHTPYHISPYFFLQRTRCSLKLFSFFMFVCLLSVSAPGSKNEEPLPSPFLCTSAWNRANTVWGSKNMCRMNM